MEALRIPRRRPPAFLPWWVGGGAELGGTCVPRKFPPPTSDLLKVLTPSTIKYYDGSTPGLPCGIYSMFGNGHYSSCLWEAWAFDMKKEMKVGLRVQSEMRTLICGPPPHTHQFSLRDSVSSRLVSKINHMDNKVLTLIYNMSAQRIRC